MTPDSYDYSPLAEHPKLLALYTGWIGQKICALTTFAVLRDQPGVWRQASAEVDRLTLVFRAAEKAEALDLSSETGALLGMAIGQYADGGWWTTDESTRERIAQHRERGERDEFPDQEPDPGSTPFQPRLLLEHDPAYPVASTVIGELDAALVQTSTAMNALNVCRLGVLLSGFCYRSTSGLDISFINSVLNDLAAQDMTDLGAENEFRRALYLSEMDGDRRPASISAPKFFDPPVPGDVQDGDSGGRRPFDPEIDVGLEHRDLILACVFKHFGVEVPPAESDAVWHPELMTVKGRLRTLSRQAVGQRAAGEEGGHATGSTGKDHDHFWAEEAIEYLGLDRSGLKNPKMALQRLIKNQALRPEKIGRRNVFKRADLDRILEKGGRSRGRGRPPKT